MWLPSRCSCRGPCRARAPRKPTGPGDGLCVPAYNVVGVTGSTAMPAAPKRVPWTVGQLPRFAVHEVPALVVPNTPVLVAA